MAEEGVTRRGFLRGGLAVTAGAIAAGGPVARAQDEVPVVGAPAPPGPVSPSPSARHTVASTVNGRAVTFSAGPDTVALDVLRDDLGLSAAKRGCGHGACGACTVRLDGVPVAACLLPASSLQDRVVTTLEALGPEPHHPVQRAFLAEDALQCGYCTPGFIVESVAFYESWRAAHGATEPPAEDVADALAGHLCRCGAYPAITLAVQRACRGDFDAAPGAVPRLDGPAKVTGRARYTVDVRLPGQAEAAFVRSSVAAGTLRSVDVSGAEALPGWLGWCALTEPGRLVRYAGQEILAVAAETREQAQACAAAVLVVIEASPCVVTLEEAREPEAPVLYPRRVAQKTLPNASEGFLLGAPLRGNLRGGLTALNVRADAVAARLDAARAAGAATAAGATVPVLAEGEFRLHVQCHTSLEPHAAVASFVGDRLSVHLSTQAIGDMAEDLALRYALRPDDVVVFAEAVGGGFGAKCSVGPELVAACDLSRSLGRPVRAVLERHEELAVGGFRPGAFVRAAVLADEEGAAAAFDLYVENDAGVAVGSNLGYLWRAIYPGAPRRLLDYDVVSNGPPGKPFRGPGGPQAFFVLEQLVDEIAQRRGEDPLVLRGRWDPNPFRQELYAALRDAPLWRDRPTVAQTGRFRRGVGVAIGTWPQFVNPFVQVVVRSSPRGFVASCAVQDIGQGARTVLAEAVAAVFGVAPTSIGVEFGDSRLSRGPASNGSKTTSSMAPAATEAARAVARELCLFAEARFALVGARIEGGSLLHEGGTMPLATVLAAAPPLQQTGQRRADRGGWFLPFPIAGTVIGKVLSGSVQAAEVEVDTQTGRVRATRWWAGFGIGRVVTPALALSQARGGVIQGLSYALYEERRLDPRDGRLLTASLEDYRIAGIGDVPEIEVVFASHVPEDVTDGAVGLGEIVTVAAPATLGNAVFAATGWRPRALPLRPDRVLAGLGERS